MVALPRSKKELTVNLSGKNLYVVNLTLMFSEYDYKSIVTLDLSFNHFSELPSLPPNLQRLICNDNYLTSLPELPKSLMILKCDGNLLTRLPLLPPNLTILECHYNKLRELPPLPSLRLRILNCNNNRLSSLPNLPNLFSLNCSHNLIVSLPALPENLQHLDIMYNRLTTLPSLPLNLIDLDTNGNFFKEPYRTILRNNSNIDEKIRQVNLFNSGKNLASMMKTLGRAETSERLSGIAGIESPHPTNKLNAGVLSHIGSFLTGIPNLNTRTQALVLREQLSREHNAVGVGGSRKRLVKKLTRKFKSRKN